MSVSIIKVGTFNTFNLISPNKEFHGSRRYTQEIYDNKIEWIGQQLRVMDAHIWGFQEVFDEESLTAAVAASGLYEETPEIIFEPSIDRRGQSHPSCALVTNLRVLEKHFFTKFPKNAIVHYGNRKVVPIDEFAHPVVRAKVRLAKGIDVYVFVVHLKSRRPAFQGNEDPENPMDRAIATARALIRRAAEAVALRALFVRLMEGTRTPVIVVGDINASVMATTSEILAGSPPWSYMPQKTKQAIQDILLYSVKDIQAKRVYQDVYYTHVHNGSFQALDHIYVSEEFVQENRNRIGMVHNVRVYNDHLVDFAMLGDHVESWQSDHGQVVAEIQLGK